jgi:hypothetical protein
MKKKRKLPKKSLSLTKKLARQRNIVRGLYLSLVRNFVLKNGKFRKNEIFFK